MIIRVLIQVVVLVLIASLVGFTAWALWYALVSIARSAFVKDLGSAFVAIGEEVLKELGVIPLDVEVSESTTWCMGCDKIDVGTEWMKFTDDGLYRCEVCRGECDSVGQPTVVTALLDGSIRVQRGSRSKVMTAQQYRETYLDDPRVEVRYAKPQDWGNW